ncbi:MAG: hypothetical protein ACI89J_000394 [Hyphomicrobiaceae bacterium]|jgi:hypothetical protein
MKPSDFSKSLDASAALIADMGNLPASVVVGELARMFARLDAGSVAVIIKKCSSLELSAASTQSTLIASAVDPVLSLARFVTLNGKKAFAQDLERLAAWLADYGAADVSEFVRMTEAALMAKPQPAKPSAAKIVDQYLQRLDETYGFEPGFDEVYDELKSDAEMKVAQLKKLARMFTKASTKSRDEALSAIYGKHSNIVEADRHTAARGGRVA